MRVDSPELPLTAIPLCHLLLCHLGPPRPMLSINLMSKAVLTAPLECSTCPYQWSRFSFRMRSRSSTQTRTSSSLGPGSGGDNVLRFDIADLSDHCPVNSLQILEVWLCQWPSLTGMEHCSLHSTPVHMAMCLEREGWEERTGSSSLNFFQAVFTRVVIESSQPSAAESMPPR